MWVQGTIKYQLGIYFPNFECLELPGPLGAFRITDRREKECEGRGIERGKGRKRGEDGREGERKKRKKTAEISRF